VAEAKVEDQKKALEIASSITIEGDKDFALMDVAAAEAKSHHLEAALQTASTIRDPSHRSAAIKAIAIGQVEAGDEVGALHTVELIADGTMRDAALMHIATAQAESSMKRAMETVKQIKNPFSRNIASHNIALIQTKEGDIPGALLTANDIDSELSRARLYAEMAAMQARRGETKAAEGWIDRLTSPVEKSSAFLGLVNGLLNKDTSASGAHSEKSAANKR
jgi:hypothetical protein